jgi:hypothetical protein
MNMDVKSVGTSPRMALKRRGTKAQLFTNASPPLISTKKNRNVQRDQCVGDPAERSGEKLSSSPIETWD